MPCAEGAPCMCGERGWTTTPTRPARLQRPPPPLTHELSVAVGEGAAVEPPSGLGAPVGQEAREVERVLEQLGDQVELALVHGKVHLHGPQREWQLGRPLAPKLRPLGAI